MLAAEEEVVVTTNSGEIIGVHWDGSLDTHFRWQITEADHRIVDIKYSSIIGGFSMVYSSGKVAFMPIHSYVQEQAQNPQQKYGTSKLQFVGEIENGVTSAINHKYQIIAFGLKKYVVRKFSSFAFSLMTFVLA